MTPPLRRRDLLKLSAAGTAGLFVPGGPLSVVDRTGVAQDDRSESLLPLNRFPRMVHEALLREVRQAERRATERKMNVTGREQAEAHLRDVRERIRKSFGPFPEKSPLNAKITGTLERDGYRIEKVIYESRPGLLVTANLYLPEGDGPSPAVLAVCGHSANGKAYESYQSFSQGLARLGFVCLIIDPIGQGERLQYPKEDDLHRSRYGAGVREHLHGGNQQYLVGEFFGAWRAWDGIRGIDYLLSRNEVDGKHIGVAGNSGGGTMTTWLCGLDERITMAAPACFVTTFRRNLENELPADTEQCPPDAIDLGLDHDDFVGAIAPNPLVILAQSLDYFDRRGAREAFRRLRHLYRQFDAEAAVRLNVGPQGHGIPAESRLVMYQTFCKAAGLPVPKAEPELTLEKPEDLWCTPQGQVAEVESRSMDSFSAEKAAALAAGRKTKRGEALRAALTDVLRLDASFERITAAGQEPRPPAFRILRPYGRRGYPQSHATAYPVETEPGVFAVTCRLSDEPIYSAPPEQSAPAILYVSHRSADAELRSESLIKEVMTETPDAVLYACDVRGIGESQPVVANEDSYLSSYGSDYMHAAYGLMLGRPVVGTRTFDVLRVLVWLRSLGHPSVHIVGRGWGALPAAFAAVLDESVSRVTVKNALRSYDEVARASDYDWPLSMLLPGVLEQFDLPDCYAELEAKGLRQIDPWGPKDGMQA